MEKKTRKVFFLTAEDESGNKDVICVARNNVITDKAERNAVQELLEDYLHIKEENEEDVDVFSDFKAMVSEILLGRSRCWLDFFLEWDSVDLVN